MTDEDIQAVMRIPNHEARCVSVLAAIDGLNKYDPEQSAEFNRGLRVAAFCLRMALIGEAGKVA